MDVTQLRSAVSEKGGDTGSTYLPLSNADAVLPLGCKLKDITTPNLVSKMQLEEFVARLDKAGQDLLPAHATILVSLKDLQRVPSKNSMLQQHLLCLARIHHFRPTSADIRKAIQSISGGNTDHARLGLQFLVSGECPFAVSSWSSALTCGSGHQMELQAAVNAVVAAVQDSAAGLTGNDACSNCKIPLGAGKNRWCCTGVFTTTDGDYTVNEAPCKGAFLCTVCAANISGLREELWQTGCQMIEEAETDRGKIKGKLLEVVSSSDFSDDTVDTDMLARELTDGKDAFEDWLRRVPLVYKPLHCNDCKEPYKRYPGRLPHPLGRSCSRCKEAILHHDEQFGCSGCSNNLCMRCGQEIRDESIKPKGGEEKRTLFRASYNRDDKVKS
eukprot:TRINITY_DN19502_c0_g2_i1.p1 TRINITY_DN19502_c0_g2~~TRINITY_DN19502_c0_g2_i1.p1  ORF type:complete len:386 (+),score=88.28 TRINITY_DN19502_c0_g2_i1:259-1416(+)